MASSGNVFGVYVSLSSLLDPNAFDVVLSNMCSSTCSCRSARNHVAMAPFQVFSFCTPLKGIRLSTRYGQMSGGDFVSFRREPDSVHDRNAIAATNRGETVGHIERSLAAALADPLDDRQIRLEGYGAFLMTSIC